ncbi:MAG: hypothetical protein NTW87_21965 [Planctomycetota bacterium]|nr:hypothetical protein [Planctomycetota bacterium]
MRHILGYLLMFTAGCLLAEEPRSVEIRAHNGRPMLFINGKPDPLPAYSPAGWQKRLFEKGVPRFFEHKMGAYFICLPRAKGSSDFFATQFWQGDTVTATPLSDAEYSMDEQARRILEGDPDACLIIRFGPYEPQSWRKLHADQLFVNERGETLQIPSLASDLYWDFAGKFSQAVIQHCESRPWSSRIIGYWNGHRVEGIHEPLIQRWLFDHSAVMTARWRRFLREKYGSVDKLRSAYGDLSLTFENAEVPNDKLRGPVPDAAKLLYWQNARDNQPLRDYLELSRDLFHLGFRGLAAASRDATDRRRFFIYDALKQGMAGWDNLSFFDIKQPWPVAWPEELAGSGHINVANLYNAKGFDGLITPHDYQARGIGGIFEPEGIVDSTVLRGKLFFCEMDTRTYTGKDNFGRAENDKEFAAITWRNMATALTRGFNAYWMDLHEDWYASKEIHRVIQRQVEVLKEAAAWPHETVPGIAMVLDDAAVLETNGSGHFLNEAIMWEEKMGLARCGVPYRVYLFEDLALGNFPKHRVFYFPNLFRADDGRLELLKEKVLRDGNVVVWGPGSGISDGEKIGKDSAAKLTGFSFEYLPANYARRTLITNLTHTLTRDLSADTVLGGAAAYGPLLFPKDGESLGLAWTKQGRNYSGLAVKSFGHGARGAAQKDKALDKGDYAAVFTTTVPLPAGLWRGLARFAGAHVYCDSGDIVLADSSVVALHSVISGEKRIRLPGEFAVRDVISGEPVAAKASEITFQLEAPQTRVFLLQPRP